MSFKAALSRSPGGWLIAIFSDWLAIVLLAVLIQTPGLLHWIDSNPLLFLSPLRDGGQPGLLPGNPGWIDPNIGATTQALGHLAASSWLAGFVPWWNPYSGVGVPLAAEMQPAALFLPFVLLLHLQDGLLWLRAAMCAVGGVAAYELARALGLRRAACLAAGVLFAFNGTAAWLPHGPERAAAFLPLILLGIERARARAIEGRRLGWFWIASGLALSIYAGFPETAYLDGLLAVCWALWRLAAPLAGTSLAMSRRDVWRVRLALFGKLVPGAGVGLLLVAPIVWPFALYLRDADTGQHAAGFAHVALPGNGFPLFLLPYLFGPIDGFAASGPNAVTSAAWGLIGGYVGASAAVLGIVGLLGGLLGSRPRFGALRWILAAWIAVCLAKTANLPGATWAVNLLPLMPRVAFFRLAEPSWQLGSIVLAALAIDDWQRAGVARWRAALGGALGLALIGGALWLAWPTLLVLWPRPGFPPFAIFAVEWALLIVVLLPLLLAGPALRWRRAAMLGLVGLDAVAMFALPLASSSRGARLDHAPIDFLRAHLGLDRFYSLAAAIPPNYGALFGLAQINDDMVPVPAAWADHIRAALDPLATPITFVGNIPARPPGPDARAMLFRHLDAYRAVGVRYVVTQRGPESLDSGIASARPDALGTPLALASGAAIGGRLPPGFAQDGRIAGVSVTIGTYAGRSDGALSVRLCTPSACADGSAKLAGAADNAGLRIALSPPLATGPHDPLRFTITHQGGAAPVAIWQALGSAAHTDPPAGDAGPELVLEGELAVRRVFRDAHVDIFELADPAPYFSAGSGCVLAVGGRLDVVATCAAPATLLRRELMFPGWRVSIDGHPASLGRDGIFQTVPLTAGRTRVHFHYAPPFIHGAYAASCLGVLWVVLAAVTSRSRTGLIGARLRGVTPPDRPSGAGAISGSLERYASGALGAVWMLLAWLAGRPRAGWRAARRAG